MLFSEWVLREHCVRIAVLGHSVVGLLVENRNFLDYVFLDGYQVLVAQNAFVKAARVGKSAVLVGISLPTTNRSGVLVALVSRDGDVSV